MSRFDNELTKTAENAWQQSGAPGPIQQNYNQTHTVGTESMPGVDEAPPAAQEVDGWVAGLPMTRQLQVQDFSNLQGEIIGGPGSSAVYPEGQQMYASVDDTLYNVYRASRQIRDAIDAQQDFDFSDLFTAATSATNVVREASADQDVVYTIGTVAAIVNDIENDLVTSSNYRQAYADLESLEGLLDQINKTAADYQRDNDGLPMWNCAGPNFQGGCGTMTSRMAFNPRKGKREQQCEDCGKEGTTASTKSDEIARRLDKRSGRLATNGNQETLQVVDVRDLDDAAGVWDKQRVMTPDHQTNVETPEFVNGADAGYVPYVNDGSGTGITPGEEPHKQEVWPMDATNPAMAPYAGTVAAANAAREKIFEALQVVERLEKLGMVNQDDRAKHIAKFEQMSNSSLEGFKTSLDMLEESGARQPRSQKVASGSNRMPEMGRMTTASAVTRQSVASDDWLMTL